MAFTKSRSIIGGALQFIALALIVFAASDAFADIGDCYIKVYKSSSGVFLDQSTPFNWCNVDQCQSPYTGQCVWGTSYQGTLHSYWCECSTSGGLSCRLTFQSNSGWQSYGIASCVSACGTGKACPQGTYVTWNTTQWPGVQQAAPCPKCQ